MLSKALGQQLLACLCACTFSIRWQGVHFNNYVHMDASDGPIRPWCVRAHDMLVRPQSPRPCTDDGVLGVGAATRHRHLYNEERDGEATNVTASE